MAVYEIHYAPGREGRRHDHARQIGRDENMQLVEPREAQIVQAFENLKKVALAAAGAEMTDIVDLTSFHTDMRDLPLFMEVKDRYPTWRDYPAWTQHRAAQLCGASYIIEIKAAALWR